MIKNLNKTTNPGFIFKDQNLNSLNLSQLNSSFESLVANIKQASNGEVLWNISEIDTSDFKSIINSSYLIMSNFLNEIFERFDGKYAKWRYEQLELEFKRVH